MIETRLWQRAGVLTALSIVGCVGGLDEPVGGTRAPILATAGGRADVARGLERFGRSQWRRDASVKLIIPGSFCSGTLITPRLVVTALA